MRSNLVILSTVIFASLCSSVGWAQTDAIFHAAGFQQSRDYFSASVTENVDLLSGHLVLEHVDLELPGNAGKSLRFGRNYSSGMWHYGVLNLPIKVHNPNSPGDTAPPSFSFGNGSRNYAHHGLTEDCGPCGFRITNDGWIIKRSGTPGPTVYAPDGTVYSYDDSDRLTRSLDAFGNIVDLQYHSIEPRITVIQRLGGGVDRDVVLEYSSNTYQQLNSITYAGRTWTYNRPTSGKLLVTAPVAGLSWEYNFTGFDLTSIRNPQGGITTYT